MVLRAAERVSPADVGLTKAEYQRICDTIEREPNAIELGMFGVLWSEHCSYKHSKRLLRRLPSAGARVLQGPGENAGAVDIGDGLAAVMKIESHNHPSAVEPFQGAATGVGGILRDIFAMGARPIALADALCFGDVQHPRTRYLLDGVVGGIAFYGNCVGVPTVAGSVAFNPGYTSNPLVNVLCLGLVPKDRIVRSLASGAGNAVVLVGSATGRDGIAGASFASAELSTEREEERPAVQVGNPFLEKLLIEACLELVGDPDLVAVQDLGAAGLTGAVTEIAAHGDCGIEVDVEQVSRRERGMTSREVMLSESQERMLVIVRRGAESRILRVFKRWGLHSDVIGRMTDDGIVRILQSGTVVAELPAVFLSRGAPEFVPLQPEATPTPDPMLPREEPVRPLPVPQDLGATLLDLLAAPNICSRRPVFEQYDHMVQTNTVAAPGEGATVLRVKGTGRGLVLGLGGNARVCAADPWTGGALAVAEACRNVACAGAEPVALTDCLNFGDPERPDVWKSLEDVVEGMREAALALGVPIISGNVSLYNETMGVAIPPTPIVGALGLLEDVDRHARAGFRHGQTAWLLGPLGGTIACSEYGALRDWEDGAPPPLDLALERRVQACVRDLVAAGVVQSATDVSEGGLAGALAEMALTTGVGVACTDFCASAVASGERVDAVLFGEGPARVVVGSASDRADAVAAAARAWSVPCTRLGATGGDRIEIARILSVSLGDVNERWATSFDHLGDE
ncbi:MAG: phosphoribosylformylglycinamidine synthase subunit PurL [Chloroflexi bacterium]|nr:phosphoribosylformylglycinamidine synthase subunit PurL [Chloroflexota bacterium]